MIVERRRYWKNWTPSNDEILAGFVVALFVSAIFIYSLRPLWAYGVFVCSAVSTLVLARDQIWPFLRGYKWLLWGYVAALTVALPVAAFNSLTAVLHYGMAGLTAAVAVALAVRPVAYLIASRTVIVAFQLAIIGLVLTLGLDDFPFEKIFPGSSSNGVTSSLIVLQVSYLAALYLVKGRVATATTIVTLMLCIVGYGRASVLAALVLMVIVGFFPLPWRLNWLSLARRAALVVLTLYATLFSVGLLRYPLDLVLPRSTSGEELDRVVVSSTKLQSGLRDRAREGMIREYLADMTISEAALGRSYDNMTIQSTFRGNPHNSYIRAHHIFGLLYGMAIAAITLSAVFGSRLTAGSVFAAALLLVILFRGFTETLIFPTVYDTIYFAICFLLLQRRLREPQEAFDLAKAT